MTRSIALAKEHGIAARSPSRVPRPGRFRTPVDRVLPDRGRASSALPIRCPAGTGRPPGRAVLHMKPHGSFYGLVSRDDDRRGCRGRRRGSRGPRLLIVLEAGPPAVGNETGDTAWWLRPSPISITPTRAGSSSTPPTVHETPTGAPTRPPTSFRAGFARRRGESPSTPIDLPALRPTRRGRQRARGPRTCPAPRASTCEQSSRTSSRPSETHRWVDDPSSSALRVWRRRVRVRRDRRADEHRGQLQGHDDRERAGSRELDGIVDICPSNASYMIRYDPDVIAPRDLVALLRDLDDRGRARP